MFQNLVRRKIDVNPMCPVCFEATESVLHIFTSCQFAHLSGQYLVYLLILLLLLMLICGTGFTVLSRYSQLNNLNISSACAGVYGTIEIKLSTKASMRMQWTW